MNDHFQNYFLKSIEVKKLCLKNGFAELDKMGRLISNSIKKGGKLMLCGNGGSAADAQHLAAELLVRLRPNFSRIPLPAIALAQDTSTLTACGNDFSFNEIFSRNLEALGKKADCLLVISTSGNSENIYKAILVGKKMGIKVFGFFGNRGGKCISKCDNSFLVPSSNTAAIQEAHITAGHALMHLIEDNVFKS